MAYAFTGEMSIDEYFDEALRQISGVVEALEAHPSLTELDDEALADHFLKPKNDGGGWELAPLEIIDADVMPESSARLGGANTPWALARLNLEPHPNNLQALLIRPAGDWPPDPRLGTAGSFRMAEDIVEVRSAKSEITELTAAAKKAISLISAEIESRSPELRYRVLALIADYRSRKSKEAVEFAQLRREMGIVDRPDKRPEVKTPAENGNSPIAEEPNAAQLLDPESVATLARVVATLSGIREHAPEWVPQEFVREYGDQLKALETLGYDAREWRPRDDDLGPFVYERDEAGNALSHSTLEFINRSSLFARLEPALGFASERFEQHRANHPDQVASEAISAQVERDIELRFSRRETYRNIVKLMNEFLRELKGTDDRLDELRIPARPRVQLRSWIRTIEKGNFSASDWTPLRDDLDELFEHVRDRVDGHPHHDFYNLPPVQQHLLAAEGFIHSTMYDIEILQWQDLQSGLDAFNRFRQKSPSTSESTTADAEPTQRRPVICLGHGRSLFWYPLRDFLERDLGVEVRVFEHDSHVGESSAEFLENLMAGADGGVVLLTAEDEQPDGQERARQNVVHEMGMFQAKFGFKRVAMVIQRGVEKPSNIEGIFPIWFEDRHIERTFHQIERWLKREKLLP